MCDLKRDFLLCTCNSENVDRRKAHWILDRISDCTLMGETMAFYDRGDYHYHLLRVLLNMRYPFDTDVGLEQGDRLSIHLEAGTYYFKYTGEAWKEEMASNFKFYEYSHVVSGSIFFKYDW